MQQALTAKPSGGHGPYALFCPPRVMAPKAHLRGWLFHQGRTTHCPPDKPTHCFFSKQKIYCHAIVVSDSGIFLNNPPINARIMKKKLLKKILIGAGSTLLLLTLTLIVHIYLVTRPQAPTAKTRAMARIDFKQDINDQDARKITDWLYQQPGVDHVMVNPKTEIGIFTFYPLKADASQIVNKLTASLNYRAQRYIPTEEEMQSGCPVSSTSTTYKLYHYIRQIF
jgi:hypothetical protein